MLSKGEFRLLDSVLADLLKAPPVEESKQCPIAVAIKKGLLAELLEKEIEK